MMNLRHARSRTILLVLGLLALGPGLIASDAQAASQTEMDMKDRASGYRIHCERMGGYAFQGRGTTYVTTEAGSQERQEYIFVECIGGLMDKMFCVSRFMPEDSWCLYTLTQAPESIVAKPEGAIEIVPQPSMETLDPVMVAEKPWWQTCSIITGICTPPILTAETPTMAEAVMTVHPPGSTVEDAALADVNGCLALGGEAYASQTGTAVTVTCVGGAANGLWCLSDSWGSVCTIMPLVAAPVDGQPAPTAAPEAPATEPASEPGAMPMPTAPPTVPPVGPTVPADPTVMPTIPVEPTAAPTQVPPPPPPSNDNTAPPPNEVEEPAAPEPTPTDVVLL